MPSPKPLASRPLVAALALAAAACSCAGVRGAAEAEAALQRYNDALGRNDLEALAAQFAPDGEMAWADDPPIRGRDAVRQHLLGFAGYRVQESRMIATSTVLGAGSARQEGSFWQRTRLPDGKEVEATGRFTADWIRGSDGAWLLRRLATRPPG